MKCPSCEKEVSDDKNFCDSCGFSLYGPRNISLNTPIGNTNSIQSNNIQSITGIDINAISKNEIKEMPKSPIIKKEKTPLDSGKVLFFVMGAIIAVLAIACTLLYLDKKDCQNIINNMNNTVNTPKPVVNNTVVNPSATTYALTDTYSFALPVNFAYTEDDYSLITSDGDTSIIIYNPEEGKVDKVTGDTIKNQYVALGYTDANVIENTLNSKKIIYINFTSNNMFFKDFYYQYDSTRLIHGQINANSSVKLGTEKINTILASLKIETNKNISVNKATVNYENILLLFK